MNANIVYTHPINHPMEALTSVKQSLEIVSQSNANNRVASSKTEHGIQLQEVPDRSYLKVLKI